MSIIVIREYYFWFEVIALLIATTVVLKGAAKGTGFRTVPIYLGFIIMWDIIANLLRDDRILVTNIINRLVIPAEFIYILLLGYRILESKKLRQWILAGLTIYLLLFAKDWAFPSAGKARLYVISYTVGVMSLVLLCAFSYYELLNSNQLFTFYRQPVFWFLTGVIIFYLGTLPIHLYWNLAATHDRTLLIKLKHLFDTLMCIMYFFYSISMLCFLWKKD